MEWVTRWRKRERNKGRTPAVVRNKGRTPAVVRNKGRTPDVVRNKGRTPVVVRNKGITPAVVRNKGRTPVVVRNKGRTPAVVRNKGRTPAVVRNKGRTPAVVRNKGRTPAVVRNKDWCFQVRLYNGCCAEMHNKNSKALNIHSVYIYSYATFIGHGSRASYKMDGCTLHLIRLYVLWKFEDGYVNFSIVRDNTYAIVDETWSCFFVKVSNTAIRLVRYLSNVFNLY
jgi:hypothetical protein